MNTEFFIPKDCLNPIRKVFISCSREKLSGLQMARDHGIHDTEHVFCSWILLLVLAPLLIITFLSLIAPVAASPSSSPPPGVGWLQSFGQGDESDGHSIVATSDGGSVATGTAGSSPDTNQVVIIKTDVTGSEVWNKTLQKSSYGATSVIETHDKGYVFTAGSQDSIAGGILLEKLDQSGNEVWMRVFKNGEYCKSISVGTASDGGFIVGGSVFRNNSPAPSVWNGFILKTNADGREQWTRAFKGDENDYTAFVQQTADDGYIVAGTTGSYGINGLSAYLLKLDEFGDEEWFAPYEVGKESAGTSVIQTSDGGYTLSGTTRSGNAPLPDEDLFLVRTDNRGNEQWRKIIPGWGRTTSTPLIQTPDGTSIIARSYDGRGPVRFGEMTLLGIDVNGTEQVNHTFSLGSPFVVHGGAVAPRQGYYFTGTMTNTSNSGKKVLAILKILQPLADKKVPEKTSLDLTIKVRDAGNGTALLGAHVYLDGESVGTTSDNDGIKDLRDVPRSEHTIRVAKTGYEEVTRKITVNETQQITIQLNESKLIPLLVHGSPETKFDIVFVPSKTSYNCNLKTKIPIDTYSNDRQRFIEDVNNKISTLFFRLDSLTSSQVGLPADYYSRFNFYYYWDPENFADAFDGCAGSLPEQFRKNAPATDVAIILYPSYLGMYSDSSCEPNACANGLGPGSGSWLKAPADSPMIFLHESGHVVFGLIDTYCGETYYRENTPSPNVWSTQDACITTARQEQWNITGCRQITKPATSRTKEICVKNFWKWDPDPDIMGSGAYSGRFGSASTIHIRYMLDTINRWNP
jgi:hypothetical protein